MERAINSHPMETEESNDEINSPDINDIESDDDDYLTSIITRKGATTKTKKRSGPAVTGPSKKQKGGAIEEDVLGASESTLDVDYLNTSADEKIETGHVVRIYVENFMCHRKLTVDFGRHVNFVTGQNGSGKLLATNES